MTTPTDKPAFPYAGKTDEFNRPFSAEGMTLREWYAGLAMQSILAAALAGQVQHKDGVSALGPKDYAKAAFENADAMLAESQKTIGHQ